MKKIVLTKGYTIDTESFLQKEFGFTNGYSADVGFPKTFAPKKNSIDKQLINDYDQFVTTDIYNNETVQKILFKMKPRYICGIGKSHFIINTDGAIYPCQFFLNDKTYYMGKIPKLEMNLEYDAVIEKLSVLDHKKNPKCKSCWAKNLCKDCPANIYQETGDIIFSDDYCNAKKKYYESIIMNLYKLSCDKRLYKEVVNKLKQKREDIHK